MAESVFAIMNDVNFCLLGSIGQAATDAKSLTMWSDSDTTKTDLWLNGGMSAADIANPNSLYNAIQKEKGQGAAAVSQWIQNNCPGTAANAINNWSTALVLKLQMIITENSATIGSSSDWNAAVGAIGPFSSMISSQMTEDTTQADAESKNMQSQLQTDNSALQPIADFGSTNAQNLGTLSNVLAQLSPA